ncbi:hypothetical protein M0R45_032649 [Rubus argutus]|uniref:Uncharacterized protein n=1 Tax=Rubus argutus TaxID=59490 RepID=A0AAW1WL11_RUBAR
MELVHDLVWTASVALIHSFSVTKLVVMAMTNHELESKSDFKVNESVCERVVMEEESQFIQLRKSWNLFSIVKNVAKLRNEKSQHLDGG